MSSPAVTPKIVQVPSVGNIQFPGDMSDDQISAAIKKNYPQLSNPPMTRPEADEYLQTLAAGGTKPVQLPKQPKFADVALVNPEAPELGGPIQTISHPSFTPEEIAQGKNLVPIQDVAGIRQGLQIDAANPDLVRQRDAAAYNAWKYDNSVPMAERMRRRAGTHARQVTEEQSRIDAAQNKWLQYAGGKGADAAETLLRLRFPEGEQPTEAQVGAVRSIGKNAATIAADPTTYATLAVGGLGGRLVQVPIAGLFAAGAAKSSYDVAGQLGSIWDRDDISQQQKVEMGTDLFLNTLVAGMAGAHVVRAPFLKGNEAFLSSIPPEYRTAVADRVNSTLSKAGGLLSRVGDIPTELANSDLEGMTQPGLPSKAAAAVTSKVLGGGEKAMAKAPIKQQTAAGPATNLQVAQYAKSKGIDLLPGQATGSRGLQTLQAVGERSIVAPGELPEVLEKQKAAFGNAVDDFKTRVGTEAIPDTETAGLSLQSQAHHGLDTLRKSAQADFAGFQEATGDIPVDLGEVKTKYAQKLADQAEALKNVPAEYATPVRNVLNKLSGIEAGGAADPRALADFNAAVETYGLNAEQQAALREKMGLPTESGTAGVRMSTAQQLRSAYLDIARDYSGNVPKAVQRLAGEAAKDIDAAMAKAADSVGATDQWRQANAKWRQLQETYNNPEHPLYKILQEPDSVKVPSKLLGKGNYGGSPNTIRQLQNAGIDLSPLKREVAQQIADKNFALTNGGRGLAGYSTEFLRTLYTPAEFAELTTIGRIGRAIKFEMNPSGTSNVMEGRHQLMGIIHRTVGATVGPIASRITTSKALARATMPGVDVAPRGLRDILGSRGPELPPETPSGGGTPVTSSQGPTVPPAPKPAPMAAVPARSLRDIIAAPDRRQNIAQRQRVADMSAEDRAKALLTSEKTGLPNRRAFDEAEPAKAVAMSDADGLKALNDRFGYDAGDALLKAKADALKEAGLDAYHEKGDEFLYRGESPADLQAKLDKAREILRNKVIFVEMKDGKILQFKGADFSYGTGKDLSTAETGLKANKAQREASGERARGELRGITQVGPEAGQENLSGAASPDVPGIARPDQQNPVEPVDLNAPKSKRRIPPDVTAKADYSGQTVPAKAPTFFSKAEQVAEQKLPNSVKADQVLPTLQNAGVKAEELKWLGLDDYLKGKDKVSKADLLEHIRQNNVQVKEVLKGETKPLQWTEHGEGDGPRDWMATEGGRTYQISEDVTGNKYYASATRPGTNLKLDEMFGTKASAERWINELRREGGDSKFSQYQLPGGSNYRELLLTLPEDVSKVQWQESQPKMMNLERPGGGYGLVSTTQWRAHINGADYEITFNPMKNAYVLNGERGGLMNAHFNSLKDAQAYAEAGTDYKHSGREVFRSGHFDEPNVLAHVRFNDRISPDGKKTLFIEEVQSDWHQKGRREGYKGADLQKKIDTLDAERQKIEDDHAQSGRGDRDASPEVIARWTAIKHEIRRLEVQRDSAVPDAPFKSTWHELAMKRMLRYAAENGYDRLAWTTGEQQAARYDLSKHVESVYYYPEEQRLSAFDKSGAQVINQAVPPEKLPDYIGKDAAEKLLNTATKPIQTFGSKTRGLAEKDAHVLTGEDLKVGGQGMKGFYDKILPDFMNKYGKKWGAKVGEMAIEAGKDTDRVFVGQEPNEAKLKEVWQGSYGTLHTSVNNVIGAMQDGQSFARAMDTYGTEELADRLGGKMQYGKPHKEPAHSIDITPSMRHEVIFKGQPISKNQAEPRSLSSILAGQPA